MNWQRGKAILISGGICLVLAGLAVFLMIKFGSALSQAKEGLGDADNTIRTLSTERVYPDAGNLKLVKANTEGLATFRDSQVDRLRARQLKPLSMTPTDFIDEVKARFKALRTKSQDVLQAAAERDKVGDEALKVASALDSAFFGSFERYGDEGFPPGEEDIPRLTVQLQTIDQLCDILVRNEVKAILSLVRDRFDGDSRTPGARVSGSLKPYRVTYGGDEAPSPLEWQGENTWVKGEYPTDKPLTIESEYYTVAFLASEQVTWQVLLDLANSETLYTIMQVHFENQNPGMQTTDMNTNAGGGGGGGGGGSLAALISGRARSPQAQAPLEGTIRPGRELVRSEIHLKVTRFPEPAVLPGAGGDKAPEGRDPSEGEDR